MTNQNAETKYHAVISANHEDKAVYGVGLSMSEAMADAGGWSCLEKLEHVITTYATKAAYERVLEYGGAPGVVVVRRFGTSGYTVMTKEEAEVLG